MLLLDNVPRRKESRTGSGLATLQTLLLLLLLYWVCPGFQVVAPSSNVGTGKCLKKMSIGEKVYFLENEKTYCAELVEYF